jgi:hypothetical protein
MNHRYRVGVFTSLLVLVLAAAGCGSSPATVSGKVTLQGKAVTSGVVVFVGDNNQVAIGKLDGEGLYVAPRVPMGNLKVAVQTFRRGEEVKAVVPEKYADPEKSGLSCAIQQGRQEYNIDLP